MSLLQRGPPPSIIASWIFFLYYSLNNNHSTALLAQWIRTHLSMQGTQVGSLMREDPTCHRATKPVCLEPWAHAPEPKSCNFWAWVPGGCAPQQEKPCSEKPGHGSQEQPLLPETRDSPSAAKINILKNKKTTKALSGHPSQGMCLVPLHYLQAFSESGTMQYIPGSFMDLTQCLSCCLYQ